MRRATAKTQAAALLLGGALASCTLVLGLDDKIYVDTAGTGMTTASTMSGATGAGGSMLPSNCPTIAANGTPGSILWASVSETAADTSIGGVAVDRCGFVWVVGKFVQTLTFAGCSLPLTGGQHAVFWAKLNGETGACEGAGSFGHMDSDAQANAVAVDVKGNVIIVGTFKGTLDTMPEPLTSSTTSGDIFVLKIDTKGALLWARSFPSPEEDSGNAVAVDESDGSIYVAGKFRGALTTNNAAVPELMSNGGTEDMLLMRLDANGSTLKAHAFGGAKLDAAYGVALKSPGGDVVLTGECAGALSFLGKDADPSEVPDVCVAVFDHTLEACSFAAVGKASAGAHAASAAFLPGKPHIAVGGELTGQITFGNDVGMAASGIDGFVALVDTAQTQTDAILPIGQMLPDASNPSERVRALAVHDNGDIFVGGSFQGTIAITSEPMAAVKVDGFVAKLDALLKPAWSRQLGGGYGEDVTAIAVDPSTGAIVAAGQSTGPVDFGVGGADAGGIVPQFFVVKLAP